jgi:hypothetical protein
MRSRQELGDLREKEKIREEGKRESWKLRRVDLDYLRQVRSPTQLQVRVVPTFLVQGMYRAG